MKRILYFAALTAYFLAVSKATESDEIQTEFSINMAEPNKNMSVLEKWEALEKTMKEAAKQVVKNILPILMDNSAKLNLSKECMKNSMHLLSGLKNIKAWAVRFLDATPKSIDGVMEGSFSSFGSYDECMDIEVKSTRLQENGKLLYRGQYCTIDVTPPLPPQRKAVKINGLVDELKNFSERDTVLGEAAKFAHFLYVYPLRTAICTPSGCSKEDVNKIVNLFADPLFLNATVQRCEIKEENEFTPLIITVITCCSFMGFLMLVGTLFDIYAYYTKAIFKNILIRILMAFSFITNFRKFINTGTSSNHLSCLNGIRFLSISWVILGHTYLIMNYRVLHGFKKSLDIVGDFAFQVILNSTFVVDTFFCIGGLLVCYLTVKIFRQQERKFNVMLYIFHRLWRTLPVYSFVIMMVFLLSLLGSGPLWYESTNQHLQACYDNWWTNLLFINNFYYKNQMCIAQSWYLAADFQLYVGALLILLPLMRWPKVGISLAVLAIISSIVYAGMETYLNNFPPTLLVSMIDPWELIEFWSRIYYKPFIHTSPYCIGLLAGYLLATKPDLKIPPFIQVLGWSLAFTMNFSVLYGVVEWNRGAEPEFWSSLFYASLNRTAWALGVAWMIICCATGHGGVINYILSWKAFVPLGRLTYVAYLVHPLVQMAVMGRIKTSLQTEHFMAVWTFFGHLCATYGIAFVGSMLIEAPFLALEKMLIPREPNKAEANPIAIENNIINGGLKTEKNGDIAVTFRATEEEECDGVDNRSFVYKL